ncbi:hypothetical protein CY35_07G116000 [Sphagnum magellanicum]|uniref:Uncharacterized protein n=1 Tax=Sphagnum magellanicum TaxID=128215 RepID=A0ACB8HP91_9BRYO|nr:hypothetical protein CY35_07G116000 [Sphagnum magellanicum]
MGCKEKSFLQLCSQGWIVETVDFQQAWEKEKEKEPHFSQEEGHAIACDRHYTHQPAAPNLNCFTALRYLDLSDNYVSMESLATLPSLQKLSLQCNQLRELVIPENSFALLENLDVSYNILNPMAVIALSSLPLLRKLNVDHNNLEIFPDESCEMGAFPSLQKLSAAGNLLSELSLIPLSKLPRLERLNLQQNFIKGIPEEVMLWDTPMAGRVAYDSTGKCLSISSPILQAAMEAQQAHQHWLLEKPDTRKPDIKHEEIMKYVVQPPKPFQHVIFTGEKMAAAIDKLGQKVAESCPNTVQGEDEHILAGSTSTIMPKEEGMDAQVAIGESGKMSPHSSDSTQCPSPFILEAPNESVLSTNHPAHHTGATKDAGFRKSYPSSHVRSQCCCDIAEASSQNDSI